jgi:hypothetical protein
MIEITGEECMEKRAPAGAARLAIATPSGKSSLSGVCLLLALGGQFRRARAYPLLD